MQMLYKEDWPQAEERFRAWWEREIVDRVAIKVTAPRRKAHFPSPADLRQQWTDPEYIIAKNEENFASTFWSGEAFPCLFVNLGPSIMSAYLGCPLHLAETTTWQSPIVEDWNASLNLCFDENNQWWQLTKRITETAVEAGKDKYFVTITDLGGVGDVLSHLRAPEWLCQDLISQPEKIKEWRDRLLELWFRLYEELHQVIQRAMTGSSSWMSVWSPGCNYALQCDFSGMISPKMFAEFFLPEIQAQCRWLDHSIYHLDGPGAIGHLDLLLEIPELDAIQWVPGAGAPPPVQWMNLLKKIQRAGKGLHISVDKQDVETLLSELSPKGLMIATSCDSIEEAKDLLKKAEHWTAKAPALH